MIKTRSLGTGTPVVGYSRPKYQPLKLEYPEVKASEEAASKIKKKGKKK